MFKKFTREPEGTGEFSDALDQRPHAPFSADLMNSLSARQHFANREEIEEEEDAAPETIIAPHVKIEGKLSFENFLQIDGFFEGELVSKGRLIIGPTGSVIANIDLEEAFISGKVKGNITVRTRLVLRGRAEIEGDITAPLISIDEGVSINGRMYVGPTTPHEDLS